MSKRFGKGNSPKKPKTPKGSLPSVRQHMAKLSKEYNLSNNQAILGALDFYQIRCKQLETYCEEIRAQYIREIEELKSMVQKIGEENLKLKELLKQRGG